MEPDQQRNPAALSSAERAAYLTRIGLDGGAGIDEPGPPLLARLQLAHLRTVPFENLDIHRQHPIVLDEDRILDKVIERRRGGYCYELNSLFGRLLRSVGFEVELVSAKVASDDGQLGPEFDHLTLLVGIGAPDGLRHVVDVGFGDGFTTPQPLRDRQVVTERDRRVRMVDLGPVADDPSQHRWDYEEDRGEGWQLRYRFSTTPYPLDAFADMNHWQQTSPDSHFTKQTVCTLLTPTGRVTISDRRLLVTELDEAGQPSRSDRELTEAELAATLAERFGIDLALD